MPREKRIVKNSVYYKQYRLRRHLVLDLISSEVGSSSAHDDATAHDTNSVIADDAENSSDVASDGDRASSVANDNDVHATASAFDICMHDDDDDNCEMNNEDDSRTDSDVGGSGDNSDDADCAIAKESFQDQLAEWLSKADGMGLTREHANALLQLLKVNGHPDLPADSRTVTKRPRYIDVMRDEFVYIGIEKSLSTVSGIFDTTCWT